MSLLFPCRYTQEYTCLTIHTQTHTVENVHKHTHSDKVTAVQSQQKAEHHDLHRCTVETQVDTRTHTCAHTCTHSISHTQTDIYTYAAL